MIRSNPCTSVTNLFFTGLVAVALTFPSSAYSEKPTKPAVTENALGISPDEADWMPCPAGSPDGCEIAVLFGDMESTSSHILYRIPPGSAPFLRFWHTSSEHGIMLQGQLAGIGGNGEQFTMDTGMYWYIPAGLVHGGVRCIGNETCIWYEFFEKPWDSNIVSGRSEDAPAEQ